MDLTRTPVVIGAGQITNRVRNVETDARPPLELIADAIRTAAEDTGAPDVLHSVQRLAVSQVIGWYYPDIGRMLAETLGIAPAEAFETTTGGNTPQKLVGDAADAIARGELDLALLCGGEAVASRRKAHRAGIDLGWPRYAAPADRSADMTSGCSPFEFQLGLFWPSTTFAMFENALRADAGESIEAHQRTISELLAAFSEVGARHPDAWFQEPRPAELFRTVTPRNRMVNFPYTKLMNSMVEVDMAAALLVCSADKARALGVPEEKWVYVLGNATYEEPRFLSERVDYVTSPATRICGAHAYAQAGLTPHDISYVDLYSCFPAAPQIGARELGLAGRPWDQLTVTGGLPNFGGPWNNYCMHAIVTMVDRLRMSPEDTGLVYGIGMWLGKLSVGIYGGRPRPHGYAPHDATPHARELAEVSAGAPAFTETPAGTATIETYTVMHDREGEPETAFVYARLADGARCLALASDPAMLTWMESHEAVGVSCRVWTEDGRPQFALTEG